MDDIQRLILKIEGEDKLKTLNVELGKEEEHLKRLLLIQKQGVVGVNPADIQKAATEVVRLNTAIAATTRETKNFVGSALQLQYVMDDLINTSGDWTRHLASISNNIPGLVLSLGGTAGIAGAIGIVSTGLIALAPAARAAWAALTGSGPEMAAEQLKEIADKVKKLREEFAKLRDMPTDAGKSAADRQAAFLGEQPNAQRASEGVQNVLKNVPSASRGFMSKAEQDEFDSLGKSLPHLRGKFGEDLGIDQKTIDAGRNTAAGRRYAPMIQRRGELQGKADRAYAQSLVAASAKPGPEGEAARAQLQEMANGNPNAFPAGFGNDLEQPPATKAEQAAIEAQGNANRRKMAREMKDEQTEKEQEARLARSAEGKSLRNLERQDDKEAEANRLANQAAKVQAREKEKKRQADLQRTAESEMGGAVVSTHDLEMERARKVTTSASQQLGRATGGMRGGTPNVAQSEAMASRMLKNMDDGMNFEQARWDAVQRQVEGMERAAAQYRERQSRLMPGTDQGGYSQLSPYQQ